MRNISAKGQKESGTLKLSESFPIIFMQFCIIINGLRVPENGCISSVGKEKKCELFIYPSCLSIFVPLQLFVGIKLFSKWKSGKTDTQQIIY